MFVSISRTSAIVGNAVEDLLAPPPRLQEPSGPQKTQVMGDQRLAEPEPEERALAIWARPWTALMLVVGGGP